MQSLLGESLCLGRSLIYILKPLHEGALGRLGGELCCNMKRRWDWLVLIKSKCLAQGNEREIADVCCVELQK